MSCAVGIRMQANSTEEAKYILTWFSSIIGIPHQFIVEQSHIEPYKFIINYGTFGCKGDFAKYLGSDGWLINIPSYTYLKSLGESVARNTPEMPSFVLHKNKNILFYFPYVRFSPSEGKVLLYYQDGSGAIVEKGNTIQFGFDLVASASFLLDCAEERFVNQRDKLGRFQARFSPRWKSGSLSQNTVDSYAIILKEAIVRCFRRQNLPLVCKWYWPEGKNFAVFLSHDVDRVYKREFYTTVAKIFWILQKLFRGSLPAAGSDALRLARGILSKQNDYWNFEKWMNLENRYGVKSTFFFLRGKKIGRYGRRYDWRKLASVIRKLVQNGWEIGLHGSYYSYNNPEKLSKERKELEAVAGNEVWGHRGHYLRFAPEHSYNCYQQAGLRYDSTLGYPDGVGYRAGTGFPFHPFDRDEGRPFDIWEIPLIVMDGALACRGGSWETEKIADYVIKLIERTATSHSLLSLLWHQSSLDQDDYPGWGQTYEYILNYIKHCNGWATSGREILRWWQAREQCQYEFDFSRQTNTLTINLTTAYPEGLYFEVFLPNGQRHLLPCQKGEQKAGGVRVIISPET